MILKEKKIWKKRYKDWKNNRFVLYFKSEILKTNLIPIIRQNFYYQVFCNTYSFDNICVNYYLIAVWINLINYFDMKTECESMTVSGKIKYQIGKLNQDVLS